MLLPLLPLRGLLPLHLPNPNRTPNPNPNPNSNPNPNPNPNPNANTRVRLPLLPLLWLRVAGALVSAAWIRLGLG